MMQTEQTDADVGIAPPPPTEQSDAEVGLEPPRNLFDSTALMQGVKSLTPPETESRPYSDRVRDLPKDIMDTAIEGTKPAVELQTLPYHLWKEGITQENIERLGRTFAKPPGQAGLEAFAGLMGSLTAPIFSGPIRSFISRPVEDTTGIPKEVTEQMIALGLVAFGVRSQWEPAPQIKPFVKPTDVKTIEGSPNPGLSRVEAAQTGIPVVDQILNSEGTRKVIENPVVDRSHDVPYTAGGSVPLTDPTMFIDRRFPKEITAKRLSDPNATVTFDPAEPFAIHENIEQHVMEALVKGGMSHEEAYRVAHFNFAEIAEGAWYRAHDIDQAAAEAAYKPHMDAIQKAKAEDVPPNLYKDPYPHDQPSAAKHEALAEPKPTADEMARAVKILQGDAAVTPPSIVAYHASPYEFESFDISKIGTGEGAQAYGHGLYFAENPSTAKTYFDTFAAKRMHAPEGKTEIRHEGGMWNVYVDGVIENAFGSRADAERYLQPAQLYRVRILADREHFLDWDKPFDEQSPHVQAALKKIGVFEPEEPHPAVDYEGAMAHGPLTGAGIWDQVLNELVEKPKGLAVEAASAMLRDAGIPGIKYLDQGSRKLNPDEVNIYKTQSGKFAITGLEDAREFNTAAEAEAVMNEALKQKTSNFVVFDDKLIEILEKNGIAKARDLGVMGPEKPPISEGTPAEAANRSVPPPSEPPPPGGGGAGGQPPGAQPPTPQPNAWQQRFEQFVSKLKAPEDVKQLIRDAAKENADFMRAREGDIPLHHAEDVAAAAGFDPSEINVRGLGRNLRNDAEVRTAMHLMLQVTDNAKVAARDLKAADTPENMIKLQEAIMRRDLAVEQVVGLRAEWGRTGNVFQEFLRDVKDQQGLSDFLKSKGRTPEDLRNIANALDELDRGQAARFLNDARTPTFWDKFMYYWVNALISGPVTHTKYVVANAAFAAYESAIVTPVAGVISAGRRAAGGTRESVYLGEAGARIWGIVAGVPDALKGAAAAARTGLQTALPGEVAQNIIPKQQRTIAFQQKPIEGPLGTAISIPSRGASAIHSFFNFLGYRAAMEAQAYRAAAKEGLRPTDDAFWQRRADIADKPTVEMMNDAIEEGYRLTYISELSPTMKKIAAAARATKIGQLVLPFMHIPFKILNTALEGTPLAVLSQETRNALAGKSGAVKQDMAIARLVAGGAVGAWAVNLFMNDRITGYGPTDPKERAQWIATGHQPYSIRIGDYWYSFNRFGSIGTMLGLYSNLAETIPHMQPDSEELTKALTMTVHSTGRLLEDEVGMQGLAGLIEAINEPDRRGTRFVSSFAGSLLPYSSFQRQIASAMDPEMREAKTLVEGLRYYIPAVRQGLFPKRDWLGEPIANAGYGGDIPYLPGASAVIQHRQVGTDPIAFEMKALDLRPAPPQDRIGGVKLPEGLYDRYQAVAGSYTRHMLENAMAQPNWKELPPFVREQVFRNVIQATRHSAAATIQIAHPQIIQQAIDNKVNQINGVKPTKLKE